MGSRPDSPRYYVAKHLAFGALGRDNFMVSSFLSVCVGIRTMRIASTLATVAFLVLTAVSAAKGQKDPQARYEPRSSPGAGHKLLEKFVGDWSVTKTFYLRNGEAIRTEGRCRQAMIHEGRFLQSDFVFQQSGKKTTGMGIIGYDPESGTFTSFWTDSRQTRMSVRQSQDRFDGKQIVLYSRSLDTNGDGARRSKTVSRLENDGRKLVHRQYALGMGGEERLVMELVMIKEATADSPSR
jgi:hypothetical protein